MVLEATIVPTSAATAEELETLKWLQPRVTWTVDGTTIKPVPVAGQPLPGTDLTGGIFLTVPAGQLVYGTTATVKAEMYMCICMRMCIYIYIMYIYIYICMCVCI